jgi:heme-degrading monooxygenase HmoA
MNYQLLPDTYYIVTFVYEYGENMEGYAEMDALTYEKVLEMPGYLGVDSVKQPDKTIVITYWRDMEGIEKWKRDTLHQVAKEKGQKQWYKWYHLQIAKVEHAKYHKQNHG